MDIGSTNIDQKKAGHWGRILFCLVLFFFGLIPYGGVRSTDSEIVFRLSESIATKGVFYLEHDLEGWSRFGVATGKGERLYPIFGPLESVLLVPFVEAGELINETGWYHRTPSMIPISHCVGSGFQDYFDGVPIQNPRPHALRFLAAVFNVLVTAFSVFVFWKILLLITGSIPASFLVSILYAIGTHAWTYAGTFFSEPLATLMVLLSFLSLLKAGQLAAPLQSVSGYRPAILSGIWLGLAITAHITAALFVPFFAGYFLWEDFGKHPTILRTLGRTIVFGFGVFLLLFLLGLYNYFRFSSFFETGRTLGAISGQMFGYGRFVSPFIGLYGLLFGAGKGIVFFMPILVLGTVLSKSFLRENRALFWVVASAVAFRILFIAARSDWHGGFCTGPRYVIMIIPFFLIPIALWLRNGEATRFAKSYGIIALAGFFFSIEQFYFCLSEIFTFLQQWKFQEMVAGFNVFDHNLIYLDWKYSPLIGMSRMRIAPFLLRYTNLSLGELLMIGSFFLLVFFVILYLLLLRMPKSVQNGK